FKVIEDRSLEAGTYRMQFELLEVGQAPRDNVVNGEFETDVLPWIGDSAELRTVPDGHSGNCLELIAQKGVAQYAMQHDTVRIQQGGRYRMTFWVKSGSAGDDPFEVGLWNQRTQRFAVSTRGRAAGDWKEFNVEFLASSADLLSVELMKYSSSKGSMLFDS